MGKTKKWEIKGIKKRQGFCNAGKIILKSRVDHLMNTIDNYFNDRTVENLHQVRIALRRVRYNMELFIICFDRRLFLRFYKKVEALQDNSGLVRDLDVFKENVASLRTEDHVRVSPSVQHKIEAKRNELENKLELELMKFQHSKTLKDFYKSLNSQGRKK
ncbi:MAG: CHAD domain-containing protein [Ignavibacterium sp.]|nr:MAG: CHAD domain-containing protein [Ignavibacterium sp.]